IAGNTAVTDSPDVLGSFTSEGFNLIGNGSGGSGFTATGDQVGTSSNALDPKLGPLADHGGPSFTMAPLPGSPSLDAGSRFGATTDQRGLPRPVDLIATPNASGGDGSDIGAYEVPPTVSINNTSVAEGNSGIP